jgi:hypothetical protein
MKNSLSIKLTILALSVLSSNAFAMQKENSFFKIASLPEEAFILNSTYNDDSADEEKMPEDTALTNASLQTYLAGISSQSLQRAIVIAQHISSPIASEVLIDLMLQNLNFLRGQQIDKKTILRPDKKSILNSIYELKRAVLSLKLEGGLFHQKYRCSEPINGTLTFCDIAVLHYDYLWKWYQIDFPDILQICKDEGVEPDLLAMAICNWRFNSLYEKTQKLLYSLWGSSLEIY